jgi:NAD(P)-dependent dehydrogenase (short-subunit alcohol dehydrogenase family)
MSKYIGKLKDKRVVVIGGSSGIGFAVAEASIEYGAKVTLASSSQSRVDAAVEKLKKAYPAAEVSGVKVDLKSNDVETQLVALFDHATSQAKDKVDHVAFTAGDSLQAVLLKDITPDDILLTFKVRVVGAVLAAKVAQRYMAAAAQSSFTITGGVGDEKPTPGRGMLAPAGGAVKALSTALANELRPIRSNVVCPGPVNSEFYNSLPEDKREDTLEMFRTRTLTETLGTPEDLAEVYLAIMRNSFVTGSRHYADGGYVLKKIGD